MSALRAVCRGRSVSLAKIAMPLAVVAVTGAACADAGQPEAVVHRLDVGRCASADRLVASAVMVGDGLLATVAHPFDNADELAIEGPIGVQHSGQIVYLDEAKDIALIQLDGRSEAGVVELVDPAEEGVVTVASAAGEDWPNNKRAEIVELTAVTMDGEGRRAAIKLEADIKPGDSGAPVIDENNKMIGMIFATSRNSEVGWAVASEEIAAALDLLAERGPEPVALFC